MNSFVIGRVDRITPGMAIISRDSFTLTFLKAKRGVFLELDSSWNLPPRRTIAALRRNDFVSDVSKHTYRRDRRYVTRQSQKRIGIRAAMHT